MLSEARTVLVWCRS